MLIGGTGGGSVFIGDSDHTRGPVHPTTRAFGRFDDSLRFREFDAGGLGAYGAAMRSLSLLVLAACGGAAFAPVTVTLDARETPLLQGGVSAGATLKLNPSCTANCELGAAFPDGGSGSWLPLQGATRDAGVSYGVSFPVAVGATVTFFAVGGQVGTQHPDYPSTPIDVSCVEEREVPAGGLDVLITRRREGNADVCSFLVR
jgi:hypothetical protein